MAGTKRELINQFARSSDECKGAFARLCGAILDIPDGDGRTYRAEQIYCAKSIEPPGEALQAGLDQLRRAIIGLEAYIKKTKWNLFKKDARATAEEVLREARTFQEGMYQDIEAFFKNLSQRQQDVLEACKTGPKMREWFER